MIDHSFESELVISAQVQTRSGKAFFTVGKPEHLLCRRGEKPAARLLR